MSTHDFLKPRLTVDLTALAGNYRIIRALGGAEVAGVVKADGYGLGAGPVAAALAGEGCTQFFVATPDEGAALRAELPDAQIAIMGGLYQGAEEFYLANHLIPVINGPDELTRWRTFSQNESFALPCWLHVDTGMNRLGFGAADWAALSAEPDQILPLHLIGVMSHFACSDEKDHAMNAAQAAAFAKAAQAFPDAQKSLCNSSGCFRDTAWHHDLLRPGYALYGGNPTPEAANPMKRVVTLEVPVLQTHRVAKGQTVGYSATHSFTQDSETATIALGYADGFLRSGSSRAQVYYKGQACPVLGRVSMDLVTIGTGHLTDKPAIGGMIEILGPHQGIDRLAAAMGTIGYEILTALGSRYQRDYIA